MVRFRKAPPLSSNEPSSNPPLPITASKAKYDKNQKAPSTTATSHFVSNTIYISFALALTFLVSAFTYMEDHQAAMTAAKTASAHTNATNKSPPRFVTVVMPSVVKPEGRPLRLASITKTWGTPSRALIVTHTREEYPAPLLSTTFPRPLLVPDSIPPEKGVERLRYVVTTVLQEYNPEFAFFVNDHTFVISSHVCEFLEGRDSNDDLYAGHALRNKNDAFMFNSGAAGYFLSRRSMSRLVKEWEKEDSQCNPKHLSGWLQGNPGLVGAMCLNDVLHTPAIDTRDNGMEHIFHAFGLVRTVDGSVDDWYVEKHQNLWPIQDTATNGQALLPSGVNCCSSRTVSFHYVEYRECVVLHDILRTVNEKDLEEEEIRSMMIDVWPTKFQELGGYSKGLPNYNEKEKWRNLVKVVQKIATRLNQTC